MTGEGSWLEQLPPEAPERQLLLAGMAACPDRATVERTWCAFALAVGSATATTAAASTATASTVTTAVSGSAGAAAAAGATLGATKSLMGGLAAKAIVIGFAAGIGVLGVGEAARRIVRSSDADVADAALAPATAAARRSAPERRQRTTLQEHSEAVLPTPSATSAIGSAWIPSVATPSKAARVASKPTSQPANPPEHGAGLTASSADALAASPTAPANPGPTSSTVVVQGASLVEQARELAATKRLLDAGSVGEALRRLQSSYLHDYDSALAEEREALYIDTLAKAGRALEAKRRAERFLTTYPASPYQTKMRALGSPR